MLSLETSLRMPYPQVSRAAGQRLPKMPALAKNEGSVYNRDKHQVTITDATPRPF